MKEKILITGSTGFIGRHLMPKLINEGYEILEVTRDISKSKKLFRNSTNKLLVEDEDFKEKVICFQPKIVIHLASYLTSSDNWYDVEKLVNSNILFLSKVLDAVSSVDLKLFINTGTFAEYFKGNDELLPAYFYAATKTASRAIVDYYSNSYNFKQSTIIPYTIYGGEDSQKKIIDIIYESIFSEKLIDLTPGEQVLDFIHIEDVTNFYISIIKKRKELSLKTTFKLGTGVGYSIKEVAQLIENSTNKKVNINWGGKPYRKSDVMYAVANILEIDKVYDSKMICFKEGINLYLNGKKKIN